MSSLRGKASAVDPLWPARMDAQIVSVPAPTAISLVPALQDPARKGEAWATMQKMVAKGEATLLGWPIIQMRAGGPHQSLDRGTASSAEPQPPEKTGFSSRGVSQSGREIRFGEKMEPPDPPQTMPPTPISVPSGPTRPTWDLDIPDRFGATKTGPMLEGEINYAANGILNANFVITYSAFIGWKQFPGPTSDAGVYAVIQQPEFRSFRLTTSVSLRSGERDLVGATTISGSTQQVVLILRRAVASHPSIP